jgi:tetratricopeptide (TPR) repeat protein
MHDLVRAYAREQAGQEAEQALRRVIDFYLHSAYAAEDKTSTVRTTIALSPSVSGVHPRAFAGVEEAMRWFADEYQNLCAAEQEAVTHDWHELTWQLAWTISFYRTRTGRLLDNLAAMRTSLAATLLLGDPATEVIARQGLAGALARVDRFDESHEQLNESIRISVEIGDIQAEFISERNFCMVLDLQKLHREEEPHARRALALAEQIGHPLWISIGMINLAWTSANLGDFGFAEPLAEQALELHLREAGDNHTGTGNMLDCLGFIANGTGRYDEAIARYQQARAHFAIIHDAYYDAETLEHLGHPHRALGQFDQASEAWAAALRLCRDQHRSVDAQRIEGLLAELSGSVE